MPGILFFLSGIISYGSQDIILTDPQNDYDREKHNGNREKIKNRKQRKHREDKKRKKHKDRNEEPNDPEHEITRRISDTHRDYEEKLWLTRQPPEFRWRQEIALFSLTNKITPMTLNATCPVTLEQIDGYFVKCLLCKNAISYFAMKKWLAHNHNCPVCRHEMTEITEVYKVNNSDEEIK